jgi:hypothetical protein
MIRSHIKTMFDGGRSRAEAERFLLRFRSGEKYLGVLDDVYSQREAGTQGRRGGLVSRMRRRSR